MCVHVHIYVLYARMSTDSQQTNLTLSMSRMARKVERKFVTPTIAVDSNLGTWTFAKIVVEKYL